MVRRSRPRQRRQLPRPDAGPRGLRPGTRRRRAVARRIDALHRARGDRRRHAADRHPRRRHSRDLRRRARTVWCRRATPPALADCHGRRPRRDPTGATRRRRSACGRRSGRLFSVEAMAASIARRLPRGNGALSLPARFPPKFLQIFIDRSRRSLAAIRARPHGPTTAGTGTLEHEPARKQHGMAIRAAKVSPAETAAGDARSPARPEREAQRAGPRRSPPACRSSPISPVLLAGFARLVEFVAIAAARRRRLSHLCRPRDGIDVAYAIPLLGGSLLTVVFIQFADGYTVAGASHRRDRDLGRVFAAWTMVFAVFAVARLPRQDRRAVFARLDRRPGIFAGLARPRRLPRRPHASACAAGRAPAGSSAAPSSSAAAQPAEALIHALEREADNDIRICRHLRRPQRRALAVRWSPATRSSAPSPSSSSSAASPASTC